LTFITFSLQWFVGSKSYFALEKLTGEFLAELIGVDALTVWFMVYDVAVIFVAVLELYFTN